MKNKVDVGSCYRDSTVCWNQWRVQRVYADSLGLPHAVVINLSDPTVRRTIACPTLNDRRRYCRIESGTAHRAAAPRQAASGVEWAHGMQVAAA